MAPPYKANTPISEPSKFQFNTDYTMGGFGFDIKQGLFIPQDTGLDYFEDPLPSALVKKL